MKEMYKSWHSKMKPTRLIKVNTIVRGRGQEVIRCRIKYTENQMNFFEDWIIVKVNDRYLARNLSEGIVIEHSNGLKGLYKILDSKCRAAKFEPLPLPPESEWIDEFEDFWQNKDLEDQFNYLMNI